jgi:transposase
MVHALSEDLCWRIVYLNSDGYNEREISNLLHISQSTVSKILHIYRRWACVVNPLKKIPGRKKLFTRNEMDILKSLVQNKVDWYLDELVFEMENYTNKRVSVPTLWRTLKYIGITRKKVFFYIIIYSIYNYNNS